MNRKKVKALVAKNNVITFKADKSPDNPAMADIDRLLKELGNANAGIPYLAIYPAGGGEPTILEGPIFESQVLEALEAAGPSRSNDQAATAMKQP